MKSKFGPLMGTLELGSQVEFNKVKDSGEVDQQ